MLFVAAPAYAADERVEKLSEAAPAEVSPEIAALLSPMGHKVMAGKNRTVCEVWLCKEWPIAADFKPTASVQHPLEMGQLLGVIRYKRRGGDFRGQEIPQGVYVMRYALQPEDGNHVGTSNTRDFVLLTPAAEDKSPAVLDKMQMFNLSKKSAGRTHPTMLSLLSSKMEPKDLPKIEQIEAQEWTCLSLTNPGKAGDKSQDVVVSIVVIGKAGE